MTGAKISPELERRLAAGSRDSKIHAVVMIAVPVPDQEVSVRAGSLRRQDRVDAIRSAGDQAMPELDEVLARFGGRRLADHVDALGSIAIETTPAGVHALAASGSVKAILEDQPVSPVP